MTTVDLNERARRRTASFHAEFPHYAERALIDLHEQVADETGRTAVWAEAHHGETAEFVAGLQNRYMAWRREFDRAEQQLVAEAAGVAS